MRLRVIILTALATLAVSTLVWATEPFNTSGRWGCFTGTCVIGHAAAPAIQLLTDGTGDSEIQLPANSVGSAEIGTIVQSYYWPANVLSADGAQCADAAQEATVAGPELYTIVCTDNDAGMIGGQVVMPDSWDGGTVTMEVTMVQTGAETLVVAGDMEIQCRGNGEAIADTWNTEVALDLTQGGSSKVDQATTAAITPAGTCAAGDILIWQYSVDATGTTATMATNNYLGFKMEYTSNVGD